MMKIHTTQDLSGIARQQLFSTNYVSPSELRFAQGKTQEKEDQGGSISDKRAKKKKTLYKVINGLILFSGGAVLAALGFGLSRQAKINKSVTTKDLKNTIRTLQDKIKVGDIKEKPELEKVKGYKFLNSPFFEKLLKLAENEPVMQAVMSAFICILLRPATIMSLPSKKGKEDNMYASAHSMSSGVMGLVSTALIAQPFKSGAKYTMEHLRKDMSEEALKRLWPKLDINSIYADVAHKIRKDVKDWKFLDGNRFIPSFKDVEKIPMLKHFNDISAETYRELLNVDVDWAAQKGKSFNEVITRDGRRLYDVIDWKHLGIIVDQEYTGAEKLSKKMAKECSSNAQVLLQDLDREFLEKVIKDADKDSIWKKLDVDSVYKDGKVVDFRNWKEIGTGKQWELDLDDTYISSALDTIIYTPRVSGRHRIEPNGEIKYAAYLKNGKDGALGTIIDEQMAETDKKNEVLDKILTWAPDILTRPLVATATIALIPVALKKVFHLEKGKKPQADNAAQNIVQENNLKDDAVENNNNTTFKGLHNNSISFKGNDEENSQNNSNISFKAKAPGGKKPSKFAQFFRNLFETCISKPLAKIYGKRMYESKVINRIAGRFSKVPGEMTNHMATLGALLTSSVYMYQTLNKKDLEDDRRRTLAVNQGLCFIIPTICAYTVDKLLKNWTKKHIEYLYSGMKENQIANIKLDPKRAGEIEALEKDLGQRLKGVRTLISLAIFTMIYRYIAPVLITPVANKIGENINERKKEASAAEAPTIVMNTQNNEKNKTESAKEAPTIVMNNKYNEPIAKRA